jgi:hypothetical protein
MKPTYLNIRRFTREKLKEGWTRQQIFDHLMESAGSGARNDYARVMRIATLVARFPVQALNWKIRWVRALMIFGMLAAIVLSWLEQLPLARLFGLLELPWYIIGLWIVSANFFNLLSILLLGPALRMNRKAYLWIMILNIFLLTRWIWSWAWAPIASPPVLLLMAIMRAIIVASAAFIYFKSNIRFEIQKKGQSLYHVVFRT